MDQDSPRDENLLRTIPRRYLGGAFGGKRTFRVMTYNVLAREYTKYNKNHHMQKDVESKEQTLSRYAKSTFTILSSRADLVSLQEATETFFLVRLQSVSNGVVDGIQRAW